MAGVLVPGVLVSGALAPAGPACGALVPGSGCVVGVYFQASLVAGFPG